MTERSARTVLPGLEHHGLRLMLAVGGALIAGMQFTNPLIAMMAPILAAIVMAPGSPRPALPKAIAGPLAVWLAAGAIASVSTFLAEQDAALLALLAVAVFLCFRNDARKGPSPLTGLVLILVVAIGPMSASAAPIADDLVEGMATGLLLAMLAAMLAHALLPAGGTVRAASAPFVPDSGLREPLGKTVILMILVAWFVTSNKTDGLYILITAATVLRMPRAGNVAAGLVASNFVGGALAIGVAGLVLVTPGDLFAYTSFAAMILVLGLTIEGGGARGAIAQGAVSVAIILYLLTVLPVDNSGAYVDRVIEIAATMLYVILGRALLDPPARSRALAA